MSDAAPAPRTIRLVRPRPSLLTNRGIWKQAIYVLAFLTYLCSFLFFGLAAADVREEGPTLTAMFDMVVALYFLIQVLFLFALSIVVERRKQKVSIDFPDRRS
jgi:hypothetical protein